MTKISTIGLDLAKNVFQIHGVDASGAVVLRRQLRRAAVEQFFAQLPPCEKRFAALRQFTEREGHCRVPLNYNTEDGFDLGVWVGRQRQKKAGTNLIIPIGNDA